MNVAVYDSGEMIVNEPTDAEMGDHDIKLKVHCCICGLMIDPNPSNRCINCIKSRVDIAEGITKQVIIYKCRTCERFMGPPWMHYDRESPQLLTMLLKKVKGLKNVKLIDANFVYTEPHSKRIKIKITIQKEIHGGTVLQNNLILEFTENNQQCEECQKSYTPHIWTAAVQVRQKVDHKRTFLFLEQMMLKNGVHEKCIKISEKDDGLDFYFKNKSAANSLMNFIQSKIPVRSKQAKKLISHDVHASLYNYKHTIACEIAPVCRDDLIMLPQKLSTLLGGIGPLVLCYKISTHIHVVDVMTMETQMIDSALYYQHMFSGFMTRKQLVEYIVIDIESPEFDPNETKTVKRENFRCVQVELKRVSDIGKNENTYLTHTHLGEVLNYNDSVMCYDLETANFPEDVAERIATMKKDAPDVVVVKKHYPRMRRKNRKRYWKLERMPMKDETNMEADEEAEEEEKTNKKGKKQKKSKKHTKTEYDNQKEFEEFLRDLEEDPELRTAVNLYKDKKVIDELEAKLASMSLGDKAKEISDMGKLIKKKKVVKAKRKTEKGEEMMKEKEENDTKTRLYIAATKDDDESDVEEDFPAVNLSELMNNLKLDE
jgi:nonsense-mediated mRNA decay protein 3